MSGIAARLREIADELEAASPSRTLTPIPAGMVRAGDMIWPDISSRLCVESIEVRNPAEDRDGGLMLSLSGRMLENPHGKDFPSSHTVFADEWVVVER